MVIFYVIVPLAILVFLIVLCAILLIKWRIFHKIPRKASIVIGIAFIVLYMYSIAMLLIEINGTNAELLIQGKEGFLVQSNELFNQWKSGDIDDFTYQLNKNYLEENLSVPERVYQQSKAIAFLYGFPLLVVGLVMIIVPCVTKDKL